MEELVEKLDLTITKLKVAIDCMKSGNPRTVAQHHVDTASKQVGEIKEWLKSQTTEIITQHDFKTIQKDS